MPPQQRPPPENRDPNRLNAHIKVGFYDVIGEPRTARSIDLFWDFFDIGFTCCRDLVYGLATLLCAPCIAGYWGIEFAMLSFLHIWCVTPWYRTTQLMVKETFGRCCKICCFSCLRPCFRSCAGLFIHFRTEGVDYDVIDNPPILHPVQKIKIIPTASQPAAAEPVDSYLGDKEKMHKTISRQMKLL